MNTQIRIQIDQILSRIHQSHDGCVTSRAHWYEISVQFLEKFSKKFRYFLIMARKRKRKVTASRVKKKNKPKQVKRKTKKQIQIEKLIVGSEWRVNTDDRATTATGKEVSSGWQRCIIVERLCAKDDRWGGSVRVKYADDTGDDDPIEYTVHQFLANAFPAPVHTRPVDDDVASVVILEQPVFVPQKREELIPLLQIHHNHVQVDLQATGYRPVREM